jgi:predicted Zn-dependent protease
MKSLVAFLVIFVFMSSGCAASSRQNAAVEEGTEKGMSPALGKEMKVGRQIHDSIMAQFYPYTEPTVVAYVNRIGHSIASHARRQELPYSFTILYDEKIHATSAPGGYVYITTGMLGFLDNEAELAAVLAHEIAQLQTRDIRLSNVKKVMDQVTQGAAIVAPLLGSIGALAMVGFVAVDATMSAVRPGTDKKARNADASALQYMVDANYDPQGLIDVQYRFLEADKSLRPYFLDYYQTHPISEKRFKSLQKAFAKLPLEGKSFSTNRETYQDMTKGIRQIYLR